MLGEIDERDQTAITVTAEVLALPEARVRVAMHYYGDFPEEADEADAPRL